MGDATGKIMVLAGGPDRERPVSLQSGQQVAQALRQAGYDVRERDVLPTDLSALDAFEAWGGNLIAPILHGAWGEGGGLQEELERRGLPFLGSGAQASQRCMDKARTKQALVAHGLPTPAFELLGPGQARTLVPPVVVKPPCEGSSIDLTICHDAAAADATLAELFTRHESLLVEAFVPGCEITVGVLGTGESAQALPPIQIVPATAFYDYQAKYERDDTRYLVGEAAIDLPGAVLARCQALAVDVHRLMGCRHLSRVDFIVGRPEPHARVAVVESCDTTALRSRGIAGSAPATPEGRPCRDHQPQVLEVNTLPGFTSHSLLPMAARHAGMDLPALVDHLVGLALAPSRA